MSVGLMLATLTDRRDFGKDWLLERKLDGERCLTRKDGDDVRLESRNAKDLSTTYPEVRIGVAAQGPGGCCSMASWSRSTVSRRPSAGYSSALGWPALPQLVAEYPVVYCVFDLLAVDGEDITGEPLLARRARLASVIAGCHAAVDRSLARGLAADVSPRPVGRLGGADRQARGCPLHQRTLEELAEVEVCLGAGARRRRLQRPRRQPQRLRCSAGGLLRGRPAPLRREGGNRFHRQDAARAGCQAARARGARVTVCRRATDPARCALDVPSARRPDRLCRVDLRRWRPPAALSWTARRQGPCRGCSRAAAVVAQRPRRAAVTPCS